jgi:hypothetical protein
MNYKCIVVTPAGRKRYLKHLLNCLKKQTSSFDEWHIWNNTRYIHDYHFIYELEKQYDWIKVIDRFKPERVNMFVGEKYYGSLLAINQFYDYTIDKQIVYIRLDDDIVWIDDGFIDKMKQFRLDNPHYTLTVANIVNNNITAHLQQKNGKVLQKLPPIDYKCEGNYWKSPTMVYDLHDEFAKSRLNGRVSDWYIKDHVLSNYERISINAISWIGDDFDNLSETFKGEEIFLTEDLPKKRQKPIKICGDAVCLHYGFTTQRFHENMKLDSKLYEYVGHFEDMTMLT